MTLRDIIFNDDIKFILSGGKGGVGKTSCAGAMAVLSAQRGLRTLVVSTDPAHSLSDSFDQNLSGGEIVDIDGMDNLWGMEIDTEKGMKEFQEQLGQSGSADMEMASQFLGGTESMALPGSDEAMAFGKMLEFMADTNFDRVVFDTAPTGHTLKLLELPDLLDSWLGKLLTLRQRLSAMMSGLKAFFGGAEEQDRSWEMLQETKEKIRAARVALADPQLTQFVVVMIPEAMAVFETQRLLASLNTWSIPVTNIIVNQLVPENPDCRFCSNRRRMQQANLKDIRDLYHDLYITEVPLFDHEIRGIEELTMLGKILIGEE
ncbi:MAG TPA: arsenic-transporting ATPase [Candidatus Thorarchaeota archaeon]|nr:MAG: arsenic-transporting ATPase [Candidatus Thorarchaeota archaeon]RLI62038.1 MAG: arsenic-transporting ATPase [Candidatus Thorarchaeota archaeon]HDD67580.1 arsenic-transporting ATPase [Candidatus Thorarchaeota archaeon]